MLSFVGILHICFALVCMLWLAGYFQVSLTEAMPVFLCMLVFVLYGLAMVHHLSWIDQIAGMTIGGSVVVVLGRKREERQRIRRMCLDKMTEPSFVTAVFLLLVVVLCTSGKVVTWWDDINFWATDVKSLYYLDGFAGKYANAAPEFGDYPPGGQLIKWWFLHLDPRMFREGLAFVGYYTMNLAFLFPLLRKLKGKNPLVLVPLAAALWFLPSIAEVYGYEGFCADLTMACIYGGFLLAATDREGKRELFYYGRLALYLGVLVLVKSIGFVWALFGLVFLVLYRCSTWQESRKRAAAGKAVLVAAAPLFAGGSWMLFCLLMRRITKTTSTAVKYMTTDEYGISGYTREFASAFMKAFAGFPLHKERSIAVDLTPLLLYLCVCLVVVLFDKAQIIPTKTGKIVLWFSVVSGAVFYGVIFLAHITIFATETQYLEPSGMISSIERYGAPFTIGTIIFLSGIWLEHGGRFFEKERMPAFVKNYGTYLCFILFVALTAGYHVGYHGLVGYLADVEVRLQERADMIGEDETKFLETVQVLGTDSSARVCYIRRGDAPRWVNNSYLAYEVSPVSVVYRSVNLDDASTDWMIQEIRASHAGYLYAEETDADVGAVFDAITDAGEFSCGVLYRLVEEDGTLRLERLDGQQALTGNSL